LKRFSLFLFLAHDADGFSSGMANIARQQTIPDLLSPVGRYGGFHATAESLAIGSQPD